MFSSGEFGDEVVDQVHLDNLDDSGRPIISDLDLVIVENYVNDPAGQYEIPDDTRYFLEYVL